MDDLDVRDRAVSRKCILVVDDSIDSAKMLARSLRMEGHTGHVAYDGASALELVRTLRPDAVILDLTLPDMSGEEVAAKIRAADDFRVPLLIALSGYRLEGPAVRLFDGHLMKPVDVETILDLIQKAVTSNA